MIVDTNEPEMTPQENPPSYDLATGSEPSAAVPPKSLPVPADVKQPAQMHATPSMPSTSVYHYVNPVTHAHVASLLPPDHPEMVCLQAGGHIPETKFGILGLLVAVLWFPIGIGLCLLDRRVKCKRCGVMIQDSICG